MIELLIGVAIIIAVTVWRVTASRRHRWSKMRSEHKRRRNDQRMLMLL